MPQRFLVTGGAGYVGSHIVDLLAARGDDVTVLDNLILGHRASIPEGVAFVQADLGDADAVNGVLSDGPWDGVLHFAALSQVGESMREPFRYLRENAVNGIRLVEACVAHGIRRFVLSSTAAVYGSAAGSDPITEDAAINPESPYGTSKRMIEQALYWADRTAGMRSACLRYFNAAGCDPNGRLGEDHDPETHLIPRTIDAALGRGDPLKVFGRDYPTPDGTCIRDYVHATDLADAHLRVMDRLDQGSVIYNLGNGNGHSVLEVIEAVQRVSGKKVPFSFADRRAGDPAVLVASSARVMRETGWAPRYAALDEIVRTAVLWRIAHPKGYDD
jgi:UDP-glucose 4-epimerase